MMTRGKHYRSKGQLLRQAGSSVLFSFSKEESKSPDAFHIMSGVTRFNRGKTSPEMGGDWKGGSPREQPCNDATGIAPVGRE